MPRPRRRPGPLRVLLNGRLVGRLEKDATGAVRFRYAESWLDWEHRLPVSLSLPLREDAYAGEAVLAVLDNLLPDSGALRRLAAERVGAEGADAYGLLAAIGRDCVGALQFVPDDGPDPVGGSAIEGEPLDETSIERLLRGLARAPLGLDREDDFRISVAGVQEKTALLRHDGRWLKPRGATPTTHILKPPIGRLPNGIDLSNSVENELYCLRLVAAFGLPVAGAEIETFGAVKALVVERFDRHWTRDGRLLRVPQEDCCQALSVPPTRKYESDGGPGIVAILRLLAGGDAPVEDANVFLKAQIVFWLIGATDGHAKNFSLFLGRGGSWRLAPLYDILTAQPSLDERQIERKQMTLAMAVGERRRYRIADIHGRHFLETAAQAGLPRRRVTALVEEVADGAVPALRTLEARLPAGVPDHIHASVKAGVLGRLAGLRLHGG